jgi:hypothetical protein
MSKQGAYPMAVPESIPDLIVKFGDTVHADEDQLLISQIDIELKAHSFTWDDLANMLRCQVVARRRANLKGRIDALLHHPNKDRLIPKETKFLADIRRRGTLLTERQEAWLQSITDSLSDSDDDHAQRVLNLPNYYSDKPWE